jgi:membrane associated rhomboid family serine protease
MVFLLPTGLEESKLRRIPLATIVIIAFSVVIYYFTSITVTKWEVRAQKAMTKFMSYWMSHPYLEISPEMKKSIPESESEETEIAFEFLKGFGKHSEKEKPDDYIVEEEQEKLNGYARELVRVLEELPYKKWGFVPAKKKLSGLLFHMFVHAGFFHLFFNLLLLYVCGPILEDVWGKFIFVPFYLFSGIVAALMYSLHYPNFTGPLIGASGAISGVMGAFLIRYYKIRIKFVFFFLIFPIKTFLAPAWLMLPLWLLREIFNASMMDAVFTEYGGGGGGVGHWAHVWGFAVGAGIALLVKHFRLEEKYVAPKVLAKISYADQGHILFEEAQQFLVTGDKEGAFNKLKEAAGKTAPDQEIIETLWNTGLDLVRVHEVTPFMVRLIEKEIRDNQLQMALIHYTQLKMRFPDISLNKHTKMRLLGGIIDTGEFNEAKQMYDELAAGINSSTPPGMLLEFCNIALRFDQRFDQSAAERIVGLALQHPDIPDDKKEDLKTRLYSPRVPGAGPDAPIKVSGYIAAEGFAAPAAAAAGAAAAFAAPGSSPSIPVAPPVNPYASAYRPPAAQANAPPPIPPDPSALFSSENQPGFTPQDFFMPERKLNVTRAIPVSVQGTKIVLNTEEAGQRALSLERVRFISVVKIAPPAGTGRPFLLLELFLSDPYALTSDLRTVRFLSTQFNPQKFIPNASGPMEAFKIFINALLKLSGAQSYPDAEAVQLKRVLTFASVEDYENSLLKIV